MTGRILAYVILAVAIATPAVAQDSEQPFLRQLLIMWLPLLAIIGVWIYFIRRSGVSKQRHVIDRSIPHMEALEQKLDRIIELLERQENRR